MDALIGVSRNRVPSDFVAVKSFPQQSSLAIASVLFGIPMLIVALVFSSFIQKMARGVVFGSDEWFPAIVVLLPLLIWTVPYFLRQRLQRKQLKEGKPVIGAFFGNDAVLWSTKQNVHNYFPKSEILSIHVQGRISRTQPGAKNVCYPDWMEIRGKNFQVKIHGVAQYPFGELFPYIRQWDPKIAMHFDPRLQWPNA